jgi:hypothetical protein
MKTLIGILIIFIYMVVAVLGTVIACMMLWEVLMPLIGGVFAASITIPLGIALTMLVSYTTYRFGNGLADRDWL